MADFAGSYVQSRSEEGFRSFMAAKSGLGINSSRNNNNCACLGVVIFLFMLVIFGIIMALVMTLPPDVLNKVAQLDL